MCKDWRLFGGKTVTRICRHCGKPFTTAFPAQKTCRRADCVEWSEELRRRHNREAKRLMRTRRHLADFDIDNQPQQPQKPEEETMTNRFTYRGTLHELMPIKNFKSGFKARDFVCRVEGGQYTDYAAFTAKKDLVDKIASLKPGDELTVEFVLDARRWQNPSTEEVRWFGGATALKVELAAGANAGSINAAESSPEAAAQAAAAEQQEALPF